MDKFCKRLRELRLEKGLTIKELAEILQVKDSTISRWENGLMLPNAYYLGDIAQFFDVTADYLLGLED